MEFCNQICKLRADNKYTQEQLAEKIGVSRQAVTKWESGEAIPDLPKLIALADCFEVSLDKLVGRSDMMYDLIKDKVESYALRCQRGYDGEDILPIIDRFIQYAEDCQLTSEQVLAGVLYICTEDAENKTGK